MAKTEEFNHELRTALLTAFQKWVADHVDEYESEYELLRELAPHFHPLSTGALDNWVRNRNLPSSFSCQKIWDFLSNAGVQSLPLLPKVDEISVPHQVTQKTGKVPPPPPPIKEQESPLKPQMKTLKAAGYVPVADKENWKCILCGCSLTPHIAFEVEVRVGLPRSRRKGTLLKKAYVCPTCANPLI